MKFLRSKKTRERGVAVLAFFGIWEVLSKVATIFHGLEFVEQHWPQLSNLSPTSLEIGAAVIAAITTYFLYRLFKSSRLKDPPMPGARLAPLINLISDPKLQFRYATCEDDLRLLAATEDYGPGGETDIRQVTRWWQTYRKGNFLAIYDGKIVGGIDIWPLKKSTFENMKQGLIGEDALEPRDLAIDHRRRRGSYWYLGSISLGMIWQRDRKRAAVLVSLLVNAIEAWRSNVPSFPAHIIALAWTREGQNLLERHDFAEVVKPPHARNQERAFTFTFNSAEHTKAYLKEMISTRWRCGDRATSG